MKMKKIISAISATVLLACMPVLSANATTSTYLIDNDPVASSGNTHAPNGFSYISNSNCYNGDARRRDSNVGDSYVWCHPTIQLNGTTVKVTLRVYLNHSTFTDPLATYKMNKDGSLEDICTINQNTAPAGFGSIYSKEVSGCAQLKEISVRTSGEKNCYTGADAIKVTYTY